MPIRFIQPSKPFRPDGVSNEPLTSDYRGSLDVAKELAGTSRPRAVDAGTPSLQELIVFAGDEVLDVSTSLLQQRGQLSVTLLLSENIDAGNWTDHHEPLVGFAWLPGSAPGDGTLIPWVMLQHNRTGARSPRTWCYAEA